MKVGQDVIGAALSRLDEIRFRNYFFFDQELGLSRDFTETAIVLASGAGASDLDFNAWSVHDANYHGKCRSAESLSRFLMEMVNFSLDHPENVGFLISDADNRWFIFQENPTALGVLGTSIGAVPAELAATISNNFLSCEQLKSMTEVRRQSFDTSFGRGSFDFILKKYC